jgi:oligopeptide transport system ATP-binding protein
MYQASDPPTRRAGHSMRSQAPILQIDGLSVDYGASGSGVLGWLRGNAPQRVRALDGIDLTVLAGEMLGLVGESGSGKSTFARCVVGLTEPTAGSIRFGGIELPRNRSSRLRRRIQIVFQDPYSSLNPRMTVRQTLRELLAVHRIVPHDRLDVRAGDLLGLVGLAPEALDAYPRHFSGGQRQRVAIARALALEPEILIADEPVSALDVSVQASVLNLLKRLQRDLGLTVVLIAHNLAVVRHVCERVAVMYLGRIIEVAETVDLFANPRHPYTQGLLAAVPRLSPDTNRVAPAVIGDPPSPLHIPTGCRFHPRCPIARDVCRSQDPPLLFSRVKSSHSAACLFAWDAHSPLAGALLRPN